MLKQLVESVEKLLLRAFLPSDDLNIVDQQNIRRTVMPVERLHAVQLDAVNHLVHEALTGRVHDLHPCVMVQQGTADSMHQVGFSHTHSPVDKKRIVGPGGYSSYSFRGGVRKLVAGSHHERVKRKFRVQAHGWRK